MNKKYYTLKHKTDGHFVCMANGDIVTTSRSKLCIKLFDKRSAEMINSHLKKVHPGHADNYIVVPMAQRLGES